MSSKPSSKDVIWDNFKQVFLAVILAVFIKTSIVEAYKIPSQSMEDTLLVGDFLLANKFVYGARIPFVDWQLPAISEPKQGDVVIFIYPGDRKQTKYIKRCVAVGGDTVVVKDKRVYVNGVEFELPEHGKFTDTTDTGEIINIPRIGGKDTRDNRAPFVVPKDSYYMMGDNRDNSWDSRFWGTVHKSRILGEALIIHWSWNDEIAPSPDVSLEDPLSVPRMFIFNAVHFFEKVRWGRLFNVIS